MRALVALLVLALPSLALAVDPCVCEPPPAPGLGWMGIRFALVCAAISFAIKLLRISFQRIPIRISVN